MIFNWFDTKEIETFAVSLGNDFCQRVPLSTAKESTRDAARLLDGASHIILARVDKFVVNQRLNFYKKACFGNKFKWHLKDAGYPDAIVDPVVLAVVKRLSGAQSRAK